MCAHGEVLRVNAMGSQAERRAAIEGNEAQAHGEVLRLLRRSRGLPRPLALEDFLHGWRRASAPAIIG